VITRRTQASRVIVAIAASTWERARRGLPRARVAASSPKGSAGFGQGGAGEAAGLVFVELR